jgi:hypothetical protein
MKICTYFFIYIRAVGNSRKLLVREIKTATGSYNIRVMYSSRSLPNFGSEILHIKLIGLLIFLSGIVKCPENVNKHAHSHEFLH